MTNKATSPEALDELQRLRDILYGDYARNTSVKIEDIEVRLAEFRREMLKSLTDQDSEQSNQLETTRQSLEDKLSDLMSEMNRRFDQLHADLEERFAAMEDKKANRRELGQMLVSLGQQLQSD